MDNGHNPKLRFGMSLASYPTRSGGYEIPGVGEGTIAVEAGERRGRLWPGQPTYREAKKRGSELHVCSLSRFLRVGWTI